MADLIELEARISAVEMILATQMLQSGVSTDGFDPVAFATSRRDAWAQIGDTVCASCGSEDEEARFAHAYAGALQRIGHLLVALAAPVQEAIDEVTNAGSGGNSIEDASREAVQDLEQRQSAGNGDIG